MKRIILFITLLGALGLSQLAEAQTRRVSDFDQRRGPRHEFQKPLAYDVGGHTVLFEGLMFTGGQYLFEDLDTQGLVPGNAGGTFVYGGVFDLRVTRKMANTYAYGFDGRIVVDGVEGAENVDERFDVYIRGHRGQISYGNFADRDEILISGRRGLVGEANLFNDGFFSPSNKRAFRYRGRFSSFLVDAAVDDDGENYNVGVLYRSPTISRKDSWSLDYHGGDVFDRYKRNGVTAGYQISYGSFDIKAGVAYDHFDPYAAGFGNFDRMSASFAASYKFHQLTLSAGFMLSETNNGDLETAYTAGLRYDMARGLSLNAGYFYMDADSLGTDGLPVTAGDFSGGRITLSYQF